MNKKGMRSISLLLAALLALAVFTGCDEATRSSINEIVAGNVAERAAQSAADRDPDLLEAEEEAAVQAAPDQAGAGRPALWEAADPGTGAVIYLFGSIHAAEESLYPLDQVILDRFELCEALALEVDFSELIPSYSDYDAEIDYDEMTMAEFRDLFADLLTPLFEMLEQAAAYALYDDGTVITDEIDEALVQRVLEALAIDTEDPDIMEEMLQYRPGTYASMLSERALAETGLLSFYGLDMHFLRLAMDRDMEILGVETLESQLSIELQYSPELNALLLEEALDIDKAAAETRALYDAWKVGDMEALARLQSLDSFPPEQQALGAEYNKIMLSDRNNWMSDVAETYLREGKRVFYVVGAGHMVGDDGVVQQLTDRGYSVSRV